MEIVSITTEKEINVNTVKGNRQLDDTIQSKVMTMIFSRVSEIERDLISKRTKEALQTKRLAESFLDDQKDQEKVNLMLTKWK